MSNVAIPGLAVITAKPSTADSSSAKADSANRAPSFGSALNKAVERKPTESTPNKPQQGQAQSSSPKPEDAANIKIGGAAPTQQNEKLAADIEHGLITPVKGIQDDEKTVSEVKDLPTDDGAQVSQAAVVPAPVAVDPATIPGLTRSADNAKAFTPADNAAGSAVMQAIQFSKSLEQRVVNPVALPVASPKDIQGFVTPKVEDEAAGLDVLPADAAKALKTQLSEQLGRPLQAVPGQTAERRQLVLPEPTPAPALQDVSTQPAPTVDTNTYTPAQAPVLTNASAAPATSSTTLQAPLASEGWNQGLGQQLVNMHLRGDKSVDLHLHPADLGPISINLKVNEGSQAQVQFFSHNAQVRSAIEQALPQLRDVMADQGIALGQATVGDQRQQHTSRDDNSRSFSTQQVSEQLNLAEVEEVKAPKIQTLTGQISTYA